VLNLHTVLLKARILGKPEIVVVSRDNTEKGFGNWDQENVILSTNLFSNIILQIRRYLEPDFNVFHHISEIKSIPVYCSALPKIRLIIV